MPSIEIKRKERKRNKCEIMRIADLRDDEKDVDLVL